MIQDYSNYENITIDEFPAIITGCNFTNCVISNCQNTEFNKCNLMACTINNPTKFVLSNIYLMPGSLLPESCVIDRSNIEVIEEEELNRYNL